MKEAVTGIGPASLSQKATAIKAAVGQGGLYDFQRQGDIFYSQYTNASNYAVGVVMQGAGYSLTETLLTAGSYASIFSAQGWTALQTQWWTNGWIASLAGELPPGNSAECQVPR